MPAWFIDVDINGSKQHLSKDAVVLLVRIPHIPLQDHRTGAWYHVHYQGLRVYRNFCLRVYHKFNHICDMQASVQHQSLMSADTCSMTCKSLLDICVSRLARALAHLHARLIEA